MPRLGASESASPASLQHGSLRVARGEVELPHLLDVASKATCVPSVLLYWLKHLRPYQVSGLESRIAEEHSAAVIDKCIPSPASGAQCEGGQAKEGVVASIVCTRQVPMSPARALNFLEWCSFCSREISSRNGVPPKPISTLVSM